MNEIYDHHLNQDDDLDFNDPYWDQVIDKYLDKRSFWADSDDHDDYADSDYYDDYPDYNDQDYEYLQS